MATIGHPLSDISNLFTPFTTASIPEAVEAGRANTAFISGTTPGLPTKEQCLAWYRETAGWDPAPVMTWGDAFGIYRGTIIMQGIAARYAMRVASSARAKEYALQMKPFAEVAWTLIENWKKEFSKAKL
jgi:aminoglycoside phosphotransferase (APT) family kinase protein